MSFREKTIDEIIEFAQSTSSMEDMFYLKDYPNVNVRRALVKNSNITEDILEYLCKDPVENVSYLAANHPRTKNPNREFFDLRPCVLCDKDEKSLYCISCGKVEDHKF